MDHRSKSLTAIVDRLAGPPAPPRGAKLLGTLAARLEERLPAMADRLADAIMESDVAYRDGLRVSREELAQSTRRNLGAALRAMRQLPGGEPAGGEEARMTGRRRADQGVPLENLLHAYRLGGRVIWEALVSECRVSMPTALDELMEAAIVVWDIVDSHSDEVVAGYRMWELETARRDRGRRRQVLVGLITGFGSDLDPEQAAAVLGMPGGGQFAAAVVEAPAGAERRLADALQGCGMRSEWVEHQDLLVGVVALRRGEAEAVARCVAAAGAIRAGISPAFPTLAEVPSAHRLAELALRSIPPGRVEARTLDSNLGAALLVASPELAGRLARQVLGRILDLREADGRLLLNTLRCHLDCGGSVAEVSRRLCCHRNTIFNRMQRIEDLTGYSPADPRALSTLALALEAWELVGA